MTRTHFKFIFALPLIVFLWLGIQYSGKDVKSLQEQSLSYIKEQQTWILRFYTFSDSLPVTIELEKQGLKIKDHETLSQQIMVKNLSEEPLMLKVENKVYPYSFHNSLFVSIEPTSFELAPKQTITLNSKLTYHHVSLNDLETAHIDLSFKQDK